MSKILLRNLNVNLSIVLVFLSACPQSLPASEVIQPTNTKVMVREHPKTGKPYVSIVSVEADGPGILPETQRVSRPDYRMLDPKVKSGEIPYDGPYSSSKRVYIFAATLATLGVAGGAIGMAAVPASAGGAATGGAGYLAGGAAVATGTAGAFVKASDSKTDDFTQTSKSESFIENHS